MKIGNASIETLVNGGAGAIGGAAADSRAAGGTQSGTSTDTVKLSNASALIALAKTSSSPAQQAKLQTLSSQVGSGQYQAESAQVSQALVAAHL